MKLLSLFLFALLAVISYAQDEAGPFVADTCVACVNDGACQYCESIQDTSDIFKCDCQFTSVNQDNECYNTPSQCTSGAPTMLAAMALLLAAAVPFLV